MKKVFKNIYPFLFFIFIFVIWEISTTVGSIPKYILPSLSSIINVLKSEKDVLFSHLIVTMKEALIGLSFGIVIGYLIAILMDRFEAFYKIFFPIMIFTQTVPIVALAPLLVLWFGYNMLPKIILVALTTFYPIAMGVYEGFQSIDKDYFYLLDSMGATKTQKFKYLKMPITAPSFFSALKISVSYSIIGAVISEWLGGYSGLGVYMVRVKNSYAYDKMFAVIIVVSVISLIFVGVVNLLRNFIVKGDKNEKN